MNLFLNAMFSYGFILSNDFAKDLFLHFFQFAECYAQAISRTKQYERKLGTARKGKKRNKRKPKGIENH